ncbi:MAG TPA: GNAT family N-acetyltransferase [Acidimicrobiales bacterium]|nr:GNAT family N-acetyltransferase [Acidimicrobiales bacterium]
MPSPGPHPADVDERLAAHLRSWLGAWPPEHPLHVVGSDHRMVPGWNGRVRNLAGVATPHGTVVSVPPEREAAVADAAKDAGDLAALGQRLPELLDARDATFEVGLFRWSTAPTPSDDPGVWLPTDDERLPEWLRPFNGDVLVAFEDGEIAAGVGRKQHDRHGHELAVVTEEGHRGRGWARRLVTQAARRVLDDGAVPTYLHAADNVASARTADASGFPDLGWTIFGLFGAEPD